MQPSSSLVKDIRLASRIIVRELGFMKATLAGTAYSPSSVHALLEVEACGTVTSTQLVHLLGLEKSSVSRMVGKLILAGELEHEPVVQDARAKQLRLTAKGKQTARRINAFGKEQVEWALLSQSPAHQSAIAQGLLQYARALSIRRTGALHPLRRPIVIKSGYRPGLVGRITEMHATYYAREYNFGQFFESQVASGLAEFVARLDEPGNAIWAAIQDDRIVGSVALEAPTSTPRKAHLRWFILDDGCRGQGVGRQLLQKALAFSDAQGFKSTELWTFEGLDAARRLYESFGFKLSHEQQGRRWGRTVTEQKFMRT
jgi:GNAT superfamily N-acetyltransferase/DNA-binding MarR family transcriptional regulator